MWKCSKYSTCKITKNRLTCNISANIINFFNYIKLFLSFKFYKTYKSMIYKGYSSTQPLIRTEHSLSEICLKKQTVQYDWEPWQQQVMVPFRQESFCTPSKCYGFLFDNNNVSDSVRMGHSSSANEALIQYLWGAHSVPFGRKQLTIWNIAHYLKEYFGRRGRINGYDSTYQLCISETKLH